MVIFMKKWIVKRTCFVLFFLTVLLCGILSGCRKNGTHQEEMVHSQKKIVSTVFPPYEWVREITGNKAEEYDMTLLLDSGVDFHSYQPTTEDIAKISVCDLFIYVGGESDEWVEEVLKGAKNKDMHVLNLLDALGGQAKEEEVIEGMEEESTEHDHEEEGPRMDEHIWLSLKNAQTLTRAIKQELQNMDSENAQVYEENYQNYERKLQELDEKYKEVVNSGKRRVVLFGDRFPFRYLVDDYELDYYAAFPGCSAETEASFETIAFLSGKLEELELPSVFVIERWDTKVAQTVIDNTRSKDQKILYIDSLQSVTSKDLEEGYTYLSAMEKNLEVLKQALN